MTRQELIDFITKEGDAFRTSVSDKYHSMNVSAPTIDAFLNSSEKQKQKLLEYANSGALDKTNISVDALQGYLGRPGGIEEQGINESAAAQRQIMAQDQQLADFRTKAETQALGAPGATLQQALASKTGDLGQLNEFLGRQQADTFNTQLKPLIQMSLGAQGLSDSGAQVELQSKALARLEQTRQQSMMDAALGYRSQAQGLERSDILGNIGAQNAALSNMSDIQRAGVTMNFQRELENQRAQLARELSQRRGGSGFGSMLGTFGGAAVGGMIGGPPGAMLGASLGGSLGGYAEGGNAMQGGSYGMGMGQMMGPMFPQGGFFSRGYQQPASPGMIGGGGLNMRSPYGY